MYLVSRTGNNFKWGMGLGGRSAHREHEARSFTAGIWDETQILGGVAPVAPRLNLPLGLNNTKYISARLNKIREVSFMAFRLMKWTLFY